MLKNLKSGPPKKLQSINGSQNKVQKLKKNGVRNSKNLNASLLSLSYSGHQTETRESARIKNLKFFGVKMFLREVSTNI